MLKYPDAKVISLGIGDTTEPIPEVITSAMAKVLFTPSVVYIFYCQNRRRLFNLGFPSISYVYVRLVLFVTSKQVYLDSLDS